MAQPYPIVGVEDTGAQLRLEFRDLQQERPIQFSLFIQAMNNILAMNNTTDENSTNYINKPNSWWQMAGIHGLPYIPWSGDPNGPQQPDQNSAWEGYCYHASALFPPWHRVLMLLVEQAVVNEAVAIASKLEGQDPAAKAEKWLQAAKQLRFPFWDWTRLQTTQQGIPQALQDPNISIVKPGGSSQQVTNPLNHYRFALKPGTTEGFEYMGNWDRTYRWVNDSENPTKEMYDSAMKAFSEGTTLSLGGGDVQLRPVQWLREKVAALFTYDLTLDDPSYGPNMWGYFSNVGASSAGIDPPMSVMPPSIEEPHNMVHLDTGGNGMMAVNEYAGFDPIFYLHHCNVDRIYAFWEYLYPEYWIESGWQSNAGEIVPFTTTNGTWVQDSNAAIGHDTSLYPFRTKSLDYWTSDGARSLLETDPINKYYTYPGIKDPNTGIEVKVDVPYNVNDLGLRRKFQQALRGEWTQNLHALLQTHRDLSKSLPNHVNLVMKEEDEFAHLRHFSVVGEVPEFAFPGSYRLELYLLPEHHKHGAGNVVNNISVLGRANPERCPGCRDRRAAKSRVRGHMHLDPRIVLYLLTQLDSTQLPAITDLDKLAVLIQGSLGVRLVKPDGTKLAAADPHLGSEHTPLDEDKVPQLTLHSHVVSFKHTDNGAPVKLGQVETHGKFREGSEWKAL